MTRKISTLLAAMALSLALLVMGVPVASAQTYPTPCKKGFKRDPATGKCKHIKKKKKHHKKNKKNLGGGRFQNTSGNDRDGHVFKLIRRGGHSYHVYTINGHHVVVQVS